MLVTVYKNIDDLFSFCDGFDGLLIVCNVLVILRLILKLPVIITKTVFLFQILLCLNVNTKTPSFQFLNCSRLKVKSNISNHFYLFSYCKPN